MLTLSFKLLSLPGLGRRLLVTLRTCVAVTMTITVIVTRRRNPRLHIAAFLALIRCSSRDSTHSNCLDSMGSYKEPSDRSS